ncbi:hypothetical protein ERO13_A13G095000v2 [Gossypium hirsutum]|uniref:E3 ubiquitin-protein ligase RHA2A n=3 Tax=Gossypium TaxID=3633 RepID=A0A1U8IGP9_GOSHI|nr:E3 ubiquitin-protein ligase RHA2A-like [Gossypium hirsutum]KAG4165819.1 hypothetical protein ERO13_A13G095000v2 [Gossypium hirsutum]TYH91456.1 hypothetical protein ES332_A13G116700v1 [Gossypium tomentosum]
MFCYIALIINYFKLAWNLLLNHSMFPNIYNMQSYPPVAAAIVVQQQLGVVRHTRGDDQEEVACAVCLCKIEEDDEMRELRCNHLFHKECLDRWVGVSYGFSSTCPICRTSLTPAKLVAGVEILVFNCFSFDSRHLRHNWWLR